MSARVRFTLSYLAFLAIAAAVFAVVLWYLLRFIPATGNGSYSPTRPDLLEAVLPRALQALAVLAVLALAGGWLLAGRMLAPLRTLDDAARDVASGSLHRRVPQAGARDEFHRLGTTFNTMMDRIEVLVGEQERFAANASHELRTPAAAARAVIEVARSDPDTTDWPAVLIRLDDLNRRTVEIVDALLALSILDHAKPVRTTPIDMAELLESVRTEVQAAAEGVQVEVEMDVHEGDIDGDPVLIRQLFTNLLINAVRHNRPTGGWVRVSSRTSEDGTVTVRVVNTGPIVDPDLLATMTEPFVRGAGRTQSGGGTPRGAGLGLALVARIINAHHARLLLESREEGGLQAQVILLPPSTAGSSA